jgi:hypothetical protein
LIKKKFKWTVPGKLRKCFKVFQCHVCFFRLECRVRGGGGMAGPKRWEKEMDLPDRSLWI